MPNYGVCVCVGGTTQPSSSPLRSSFLTRPHHCPPIPCTSPPPLPALHSQLAVEAGLQFQWHRQKNQPIMIMIMIIHAALIMGGAWRTEVRLGSLPCGAPGSNHCTLPPFLGGTVSVFNCSTCRKGDMPCWDMKACYPGEDWRGRFRLPLCPPSCRQSLASPSPPLPSFPLPPPQPQG